MGDKKRNGLGAMIKVCSEILKVSKKYSYLWDNPELISGALMIFEGKYSRDNFFGGYTAYRISLQKSSNNKIFFNSDAEFGYCGTKVRKAAAEILRLEKEAEEKITPEKLRKSFYLALKEPLGKYLAKKELLDKL